MHDKNYNNKLYQKTRHNQKKSRRAIKPLQFNSYITTMIILINLTIRTVTELLTDDH